MIRFRRSSMPPTAPTLAAVALALAATLQPAAAQPAGPAFRDEKGLPDGPVGERIRELLDVVSSNDPARVKAFVASSFAPALRDAFPIQDHIDVLLGAYETSHGYDLYGIRRYDAGGGPEGTVAIVSNRLTGAWEAFVLDLEPGPPHRIVDLQITRARRPKEIPPEPALTEAEALRELAAFVERLAKADVFSGSVLLAKDGRTLYQAAFGEALKGYGISNRIDTKFNLGSMNKMFTAVAVLQLVERGALSLGDPLSKHLEPDWLPGVDMSKVRLEHLLTHTSGLGSYFNETFMRSSRSLYRRVADYKPLLEAETLAFEPGTRWQYSNTGFLLLGAVVEKASGEDYFEYVRGHIYAPAGMKDSDCYEMDTVVPNLAFGYSREKTSSGTRWRNNLYRHVIKGGPAGGGFSTAEDLLRFGEALRAHKLLSAAGSDLLWSPKPDLGSDAYGYGFGVHTGALGRKVGHSGGFSGISSNLDLFLDTGWTAIVLSNYGGGSSPVVDRIEEILLRIRR